MLQLIKILILMGCMRMFTMKLFNAIIHIPEGVKKDAQ